jgi:uncharacterized SAM-binding protein YcdF (DUF218 family)
MKFILGILVVWLISFICIEALILESTHSDEMEKVEYVIVLGAGLRGEQLSLSLYYRLNKAIEYLNFNPQSKAVVSGGQGPGEDITEAEAMKRFLIAKGIQENRVLVEDKSTSTFENLLYTKRILEREEGYIDGKIMIVTNDFHMFRAKFLASRLGFIPYGAPAMSVNYLRPYQYFREYFGFIKSLLFDWVSL